MGVNKINPIKTLKVLLVIFIISICSISPVVGLGLLASPPDVKFKIEPSETASGEILVKNIGADEVNVTISKTRLLKDNIHLEYSDTGIAQWIVPGITNFTLKPGETKTVPFKVIAPENINYNDAMGAILVTGTPLNVTNSNSTVNIKQGIQLIVPIIVGLPGPIIESLQLLEHSAPTVLISYMPGDFIYHVKNNGTVYANMTGNIEIMGLISDHKVPIQGGVFPEDQYYANTTWEPGFSDFGLYSADTTIKYGRYNQTQTLKTHDTILVIPIWLIILIILAVLIWYIRKKDIKPPIKIKIERK